MSIPPGCIHDQTAFVGTYSLRKCFRPLFVNDLLPPFGAWRRNVNIFAVGIKHFGHDNFSFELGIANLTFDAAAVDSKVSKILQQFLTTILTSDQLEEFGSVIDKRGPAVSINEGRMSEE